MEKLDGQLWIDNDRARMKRLMDSIGLICEASGLFEEITYDFTFGCYRLECIPHIRTPDEQPPEP